MDSPKTPGFPIDEWERHLLSRNRSPRTIASYQDSVARFLVYLARKAPSSVKLDLVDRKLVEGFISDQLVCHAPATAAVRFRSLQQFFRWAVDEQLIPESPMARMKPPKVPEVPVAVIDDVDLKKLLDTCEIGQSRASSLREFDNRRDRAILRLFIDTPTRLSEMANLELDDLDVREGLLRIYGKGAKTRYSAVGPKALKAIDTYLRVRTAHDHGGTDWLWIGMHGHFTGAGVSQMIRRRCQQAGIGHIHPHQFRHTFAHTWLQAGGNEGDLMEIAGWSSHDMLRRYAKSTAAVRAQAAAKRFDVGSRV